jgi:hypothetical protein
MQTKHNSETSTAHAITPFWQRLPQFFAYPANAASLVYMFVLSLASYAFFFSPLIGLLLYLGAWGVFFNHAFAILERTSMGHLAPGASASSAAGEGVGRPLKQLGVLILVGYLDWTIGRNFGQGVGVLFRIVAALCLPASIMIIAVTDSLIKAINPLWLVMLIRNVGWPYLLLYVFLLLLSEGSQYALALLAVIPDFLVYPFATFILMYFLLIMYNMMGYVLYQYHEPLGLAVAVKPEAHQGASLQDRLGTMVVEGNLQDALATLEVELKRHWEDDTLHERYHKVLVLAGKKGQACQHGREYLGKLVAEKKPGRAVGIYRECLALDAEFKPMEGSHVLRLATSAVELREYPLALDIMKDFAGRFPRHPDIPAANLLAAKVCLEHLQDPARAKPYLLYLLHRYKEHPLAPRAQQYLNLIEKLGGAPVG